MKPFTCLVTEEGKKDRMLKLFCRLSLYHTLINLSLRYHQPYLVGTSPRCSVVLQLSSQKVLKE